MLRAASQSATAGVLVQHDVSTSSPPRWRKSSGKSPDGAPRADGAPPVHSPSSAAIRSNVALLATLSGDAQSGAGQISG